MRFDMPFVLSASKNLCALAVAAGAVAGCAHAPEAANTDIGPPAPAPAAVRPDPVVLLLDYARRLANASPEQRADAVKTAHRDASKQPSARAYARLALAYGTPDQRRYTPDEAARYAERALAADDAGWSPAAQQYLRDYVRLYGIISASDQSATAGAPSRRTVSTDRTGRGAADDRERITRLQAQLAEAHRKLREMADIEDRLGEADP